jgi:hypothetical protein
MAGRHGEATSRRGDIRLCPVACRGLPDGFGDPASPECIDNDSDEYGDPGCQNCPYHDQDCDDTESNVKPGVPENCSNGIDDHCNGLADCLGPGDPQCNCGYSAAANAEAASCGSVSLKGSGIFNELALLHLPVCALIVLRIWPRKRWETNPILTNQRGGIRPGIASLC